MHGVELSHDLPMPIDQRLHAVAFAQQFIPVHGIELEGIAFTFFPILGPPPAEIPRVMMQCPTVNGPELAWALAENFFKKTPRPLPIIAIRTRSNERELLAI